MNLGDFTCEIGSYIKQNIPFFFLVDFEKKAPVICPLDKCEENGIFFQLNEERKSLIDKDIDLNIIPISESVYSKSFDVVKSGINRGDSFLVNLTFPTPVESDSDLNEIYRASKAKYKLYFKDQFVVFSPESFIQIRNNSISTYPMKGTIMANKGGAADELMNSKKEQWEHNTIVDLMRNDLSMVAKDVEVKCFRFLSEIMTHRGLMYQTSSEITGTLDADWQKNFGQLLLNMLPAGSISGAPKDKTVSIIKEAEISPRGYYTGVFGVYNNGNVDSAVAIRYIEKTKQNKLQYRSGGGITFMSKMKDEYREIIDKVYVPTK